MIIEGSIREQWMDIIIMSRRGKMKVLINYNIYILYIILLLYDKSDTSYIWYQATDKGAMDRYEQ